jgi:hypothetical protein
METLLSWLFPESRLEAEEAQLVIQEETRADYSLIGGWM